MIRPATPADYDQLLALGRAMHAESRYAGMDLHEPKLVQWFDLAAERGFLRVWQDPDGSIQGGLLAMIGETWFGRDLLAYDLALFIVPGRRGGIIAARLCQAYVEWAIAAGAAEISIGTTTGVQTEAAERLYQGLGFERIGALYRRRI